MRRARTRPPFAAALLALLSATCLLSIAPAWSFEGSHRPCFGAASRDPYRVCHNPSLERLVIPSPMEAQIVPNATCIPLSSRTPLEHEINACTFGAPTAAAHATVALVGNSHAAHWRAALQVVTERLGWHGLSITRSSCPFLLATVELAEPERRECVKWHERIIAWFRANPGVATIFVSDQPTTVLTSGGRSVLGTQVAGYIRAWGELPPTVRHIIVIRDNPYARLTTLPCVEAAIARHVSAAAACALPRSLALKPDPQTIAAHELHSPRVQVIDLTQFFCDSRLCYPVVGGALVYRDGDHLTRVFAATLGPYLLHALGALMRSWR